MKENSYKYKKLFVSSNEQEKGNTYKSNSSKDFHKTKTPKGSFKKERNFKVEEKIDKSKPLKEILEDNVPNFGKPGKEEFIDNQILIDYIIHEKYKGTEIKRDNYDEIKPFKNDNTVLKNLFEFYNTRNCKVYIDDLIDPKTYYRLQKYYFNENALKKKIRIHLDIDKALLKDEKKVKYIVEKIISKISEPTKTPKNDLYVTNVRKNCLICDIYHVVQKYFNNVIHYFVGDIAQNFIEENENDLVNFLREIYNEIRVENMNQILLNRHIIIGNVINNYIISPNLTFDFRFNKPIGKFGYRSFLIFNWNEEKTLKNGKYYFYPNKRWKGYGLRIPYKEVYYQTFYPEEIFDSNGDWCICYTDLAFSQLAYNIDHLRKDTFSIPLNERFPRFSLLLQCKIKKNAIFRDDNNFITLYDNNYITPYRILIENID